MIVAQMIRSKHWQTYLHKAGVAIDVGLAAFCLAQMVMHMMVSCVMLFYLFYALLFLILATEHLLIIKLPKMNVQIHERLLRRSIGFFGLYQTVYLFGAIMFWGKTDIHPGYCTLCTYYGLHLSIGILLALHCFWSVLIFASLIHSYITRRYYLLAIGGYQVQQRRLQQIDQINNRAPMIEPDYNHYPLPPHNSQDKYYQFQDVEEGVQLPQNFVCSICLNEKVGRKYSKQSIKSTLQMEAIEQKDQKNQADQESQDSSRRPSKDIQDSNKKAENNQQSMQVIITPCKHFFHKNCIENWVRVTPKCPDCRMDLSSILK